MNKSDTDDEVGVPPFAERYRLGDVLGVGGTATVYEAWDNHLNRPVAVKLYPADEGGTDRARGVEVAALARLRHPGLVTLYDAGIEGDRGFVVMQLVDGESLADRIRRAPLPVPDAARLGVRLASTLAHVHEQGFIHRDLKPANVLLDAHGLPHLADFGVSRLIDATRNTTTGFILGTPAYLSPEQVRGQELGPPVDIYSLGLVLLEAVTGRREYPGVAVEAAVARLFRAPEIPAELPYRMRSILAAMTADDAAARPAATEVTAALKVVAEAEERPAFVLTPVTASSRPRRRFRWSPRALLSASAASTAVLAVALMLTLTNGAADVPAAANEPQASGSGQPAAASVEGVAGTGEAPAPGAAATLPAGELVAAVDREKVLREVGQPAPAGSPAATGIRSPNPARSSKRAAPGTTKPAAPRSEPTASRAPDVDDEGSDGNGNNGNKGNGNNGNGNGNKGNGNGGNGSGNNGNGNGNKGNGNGNGHGNGNKENVNAGSGLVFGFDVEIEVGTIGNKNKDGGNRGSQDAPPIVPVN